MRTAAAVLVLLVLLAPGAAGLGTSLKAVRAVDWGTTPGAGGVLGLTGDGVVVAVLDGGVDDTHPSLAGAYLAGAEVVLGVGLSGPLDIVERNPSDTNGHGTHVANIVMGRGLADGALRGVAPKARLVDVKVTTDQGFTLDGLEVGLEWVLAYNDRAPAAEQVEVVSISLGTLGPGDGDDRSSELIRDLVSSGVVVVAAAGNCGPEGTGCGVGDDEDTITSPGSAPAAITVGAVDDRRTPSPADDTVAGFSSRGPGGATELPERKPNVVAPGKGIVSAVPGGGSDDLDGTSQAVPHVSGIVALLLEAKPSLTPSEAKDALQRTARDMGVPGWDKESGYGEVDAYEAARHVRGGNVPPVAVAAVDPLAVDAGGLVALSAAGSRDPDGLTVSYRWDVPGLEPLAAPSAQVRLDAPGNATIRLTVTDADGATAESSVTVRVTGPPEGAPPEEPPPAPEENVTDHPPAPRIFADPPASVAGERVTFDGTGSTDDRGVVAWTWDLDGDGAEDATGGVVEHAYDAPGIYTVNLTVRDASGQARSAEAAYVVSPDPDAGLPEDRRPPVVRILQPTPGARLTSPVRVQWEATDDGPLPSARLVVDRLARVVATAGAEDLDLARGAHVVAVEATDEAGNVGRESVAFLVDEPLPRIPERVTEPRESPTGGVAILLAAGLLAAMRRGARRMKD